MLQSRAPHFEFKPSRYLAVMLGAAHAAFLIVLPLLALPFWAKSLLLLSLMFSLGYYLRRDAWLLAADSCVGLLLHESEAVLILRDGRQLHGTLAADSLVTPLLTVLNVSLPERFAARSVVVLPDSMAAEAFRQLRVWLKWGAQGAQ